jgi:hypothetical protein
MHDRARLALAEATTAVEEVADTFESEGLRERAFDCYQLIARLGVEAGAFENIAEGYLNSVRILRDDGLKLDALRLYETFVALARDRGEHHAVAAILREAADYCTRAGLPYADDLRWRSAEAWIKAGGRGPGRRPPGPDRRERLPRRRRGVRLGPRLPQVAEVYRRLAGIELPARTASAPSACCAASATLPPDAPRPMPVPEFLKAAARLRGGLVRRPRRVGARRRPRAGRRRRDGRPPLPRLRPPPRPAARPRDRAPRRRRSRSSTSSAASSRSGPTRSSPRSRPCTAAATPRCARPSPPRWATLRFKRSFSLVSQALRDPVSGVRKAAANSVRRLIFPHAFEPLRRIFEARDLPDPEAARESALHAIGKIGTVEALDFLCDRLREGEQPLRRARPPPRSASLSNPELLPYLRRQIEFVPAEHRAVLEDTAQHLEQRLR